MRVRTYEPREGTRMEIETHRLAKSRVCVCVNLTVGRDSELKEHARLAWSILIEGYSPRPTISWWDQEECTAISLSL